MSAPRPITLAVAALGGEGGGVICDWLIGVARRAGYLAQATSVPGVAQRTGATVYYLEFFAISDLPHARARPIFALMPNPGDVDIVVASEIVESGRMLQRGLVTKRTTLISSSHRVYSIHEKSHLGDGRADAAPIRALAKTQAKRFIEFDMRALAELHGSPISAALLGALCGSGALPFAEADYRAVILESGMKVSANLASFDAAARAAGMPAAAAIPPEREPAAIREHFESRLDVQLSPHVRDTVRAGVSRLIDYQDQQYASIYLERLKPILEWDRDTDQFVLGEAVARGLALWMSFEDIIRVADLKIRANRVQRIKKEVRSDSHQLLTVTEFLSPRLEEVYATLPPGFGSLLQRFAPVRRAVEKLLKPREVATSRVGGFLLLYTLASLRRWRRHSRRYGEEHAAILEWLRRINDAKQTNYALAVQIAECQQLLKGYGKTQERGRARFDAILTKASGWQSDPRGDERVRALRLAALADEEGTSFSLALDAA